MSIAPPPPVHPWPAQPPAPPSPRRRWIAIVAAGVSGAIVAAAITAVIMVATTPKSAKPVKPAAAPTMTVTAAPAPPPAALPTEQADAQTCHSWGTADMLVSAAGAAQAIIPQGMTFTDPAIQDHPEWKAGVLRAADLYQQAATALAPSPGTSSMLAQFADTTASALRTMSEAYKTFDPDSGYPVDVFRAGQKALYFLCENK